MASIFANREKFLELATSCESVTEMIRSAGLRAAGGSYGTVRRWSEVHNIELPVYDVTAKTLSARMSKTKHSFETMFCENSAYSRHSLKKYIKKNNIIPWLCATPGCGLTNEWLGKPIILQLEHKNGINNDNRIENLCLLCPNCHSQTDTFAGKRALVNVCNFEDCTTLIRLKRVYCDTHLVEAKRNNMCVIGRKGSIEWPSAQEILDRLQTESYTSIGKSFGATDNAVRKYLKKNNIEPPRKHIK